MFVSLLMAWTHHALLVGLLSGDTVHPSELVGAKAHRSNLCFFVLCFFFFKKELPWCVQLICQSRQWEWGKRQEDGEDFHPEENLSVQTV